MEEIYQRRSIRSYNEKDISKESIKKIIKAGMNAPSAMNSKPCIFLAITDKKILKNLSQLGANAFMLEKCKAAIVVLVKKSTMFWQQDGAAATQNILLEATTQDIGSCWIGITPNESYQNYLENNLGITEDYEYFSIISLGYTDKQKLKNDYFNEEKIKWLD